VKSGKTDEDHVGIKKGMLSIQAVDGPDGKGVREMPTWSPRNPLTSLGKRALNRRIRRDRSVSKPPDRAVIAKTRGSRLSWRP